MGVGWGKRSWSQGSWCRDWRSVLAMGPRLDSAVSALNKCKAQVASFILMLAMAPMLAIYEEHQWKAQVASFMKSISSCLTMPTSAAVYGSQVEHFNVTVIVCLLSLWCMIFSSYHPNNCLPVICLESNKPEDVGLKSAPLVPIYVIFLEEKKDLLISLSWWFPLPGW